MVDPSGEICAWVILRIVAAGENALTTSIKRQTNTPTRNLTNAIYPI